MASRAVSAGLGRDSPDAAMVVGDPSAHEVTALIGGPSALKLSALDADGHSVGSTPQFYCSRSIFL